MLALLRKFLRWLALGPPPSAKNVKVTHAYRAKLSAYNKIAESFKEFPPVEQFQARLNYVGHIVHRVLQQGLRKEDKSQADAQRVEIQKAMEEALKGLNKGGDSYLDKLDSFLTDPKNGFEIVQTYNKYKDVANANNIAHTTFKTLVNIKLYYQLLLASVRYVLSNSAVSSSASSERLEVYLRNACFDEPQGVPLALNLELHQQIARYVFAASNHGPKRSLHWWSTGSGKSAAIVSWLAGRVEKPAEDIVLNISLRRARILDKHPPLNLIILTKSGLLEDVVKDMWAFFWRNDDLLRHVIAQSGKLSSKEINAYLEDNRDVIINDLTRTDWGQYLWEV